MLSKEARKERNERFWADFKEAMRKRVSVTGRRVNWATYPTEVKDTYLRLICDGRLTAVCYDIQFRDEGVRAIFWEQLGELRAVMENSMTMKGEWLQDFPTTDGRLIHRISWCLEGKNFYRDEDWPEIHAFFRERLLEFDAFYQEFKDILIALVD